MKPCRISILNYEELEPTLVSIEEFLKIINSTYVLELVIGLAIKCKLLKTSQPLLRNSLLAIYIFPGTLEDLLVDLVYT